MSKSKYIRKLTEVFFNNLGRATKEHLQFEDKDEEFVEAYRYLRKIERKLLTNELEKNLNSLTIDNLSGDNVKEFTPNRSWQDNGRQQKGYTVTNNKDTNTNTGKRF
jgi:hypothetical protein